MIKIPEQVKWLNAHIRRVEHPLRETPKVLQSVGVFVITCIFDRMIDHLMLELIQTFMRCQGVGIERRACLYVLTDLRLQYLLTKIRYSRSSDRARLAVTCRARGPRTPSPCLFLRFQ